jgi:hypothetical protein
MTLLQAHRVLIASSIIVCGIYTIRQAVHYARDSSVGTLLSGGIALLIGVVLSCYLYSLRRR